MSENLKEKTSKGILWSFFDKFGQQVIALFSQMVLARTILEEEFGTFALMSIFLAIASTLVDSGFNRGLLNKKQITQDECNTVFYFNLLISIIIYGVLFFIAPWIAHFYNNEALVEYARILFLIIPINAIASIQIVQLWKKLDLKIQSITTNTSLFISYIISLSLALAGWGIWALVAQNIIFSLGKSFLLWYMCKWRPTLTFKPNVLIELFPFGSKLLLAGVLNGIFNNIYVQIIGILFPITEVGNFSQANKYQEMSVGTLMNTFRAVAIPVFSEIKNDTERLHRVMSRMVALTAFAIAPLVGYLIATAEAVIVTFFSDRWLPSVPYFKVLCVGGLIASFNFIFNESMVAKGRSDIFMGLEFVKKGILLLLIIPALNFGVVGLTYSWVTFCFISLLTALYFSKKIIGYGLIHFFKDILPYLLLAFGASVIGYYICNNLEHRLLKVIAQGSATVSIYLLGCWIFRLSMLNEILKSVKIFKK